MNKKLISLLIAICLVVGMLPIMSIAENQTPATAKVAIMKSTEAYEVTEGGEPVYGKSVAFDGYKSNGTASGTGWKFTTEGASANDWNFKFEYPQGGTPTLTLKDAKLVQIDASGNTLYVPKADGSGYESTGSWSVVQPKNQAIDLKVVLQGENQIQTTNGIVRGAGGTNNKFNSVTVVGEAGSSLTGTGKAIGFQGRYGVPFTFENVNLNLTTSSNSAAAAPIYTEDANITIRNSKLNFTTTKGTVNAIHAEGTGLINVVGSEMELTATGAAFNKAPQLAEGITAVAGADAASATTADAAALATAKYAKLTYTAPAPTETTAAPTVSTQAPTQTTAPAATVAPGGDLAESYTVKIDGVSLTINKYDTPVYSKNTTKTGYFNTVSDGAVSHSEQRDYIGQATTGGDESDYNAKLVWKTGDEAPTLYLKDLIVDNYNEELGKWRYSSATNKNYIANAAIFTGNNAGLKIVLQGGESSFQTYDGLHYRKDLTIESEGDASLKLWTWRTGIIPTSASSGYANASTHLSGNKLTLDANLNVSLGKAENKDNGAYVIRTIGADMVIKGGNIVTELRTAPTFSAYGVGVATSGNLYVNGGTVSSSTYFSENLIDAAFMVAGDLYVTGGTMKATSAKQSGIRAANVYISGGKVEVETNYAGIFVSDESGVISITGGEVEVTRNVASETFAYLYKNGSKSAHGKKALTLGSNAYFYAGATKDAAQLVDSIGTEKYVKVTYTAPAPGETTAPSATTAPSTTTAPTTTTAPSTTTAPTSTTAPAETTLPADALAAEYSVKIDGVTLKITAYDKAVYSQNTTKTGYFNTVSDGAVSKSEERDYIGQVVGGDETNYNVKLIWHKGDAAPTLYLKGAIVDNYNEELGKWRYSAATNKNYLANAAIYTGSTAPLKIVVEADSEFQTYDGIHYQNDLTIESRGDAKLTVWTNRTGILPTSVSSGYANSHLSGFDLTLAANLKVSLGKYENDANAGYIIRAKGGDIVVNGGNIVVEYREAATKNMSDIGITGGNLYVNAGTVYSQSYNSSNLTNAGYMIDGDVYVTGGTLKAYSKNQAGIRAKNFYITGGKVETDSLYSGLLLTAETGVISITGGEVLSVARASTGAYAFAYIGKNGDKTAQLVKVPTLASDLYVYGGGTLGSMIAITNLAEYSFSARAILVSKTAPDNITLPTDAPTQATTAPTQPSIEVTIPTGDAVNYTVKIDGITYKLEYYDTPVYSQNATKTGAFNTVEDGVVTGSVAKDYIGQTIGGDETNYNIKLVWVKGESMPTLYLKGAIVDNYNEELGKWRYTSDTYKYELANAAIFTGNNAPLKIVVESDSTFQTYDGIHYQQDLTIESVGDAKLTLWTQRTGIAPTKVGSGYINSGDLLTGFDLTLNANVDLSLGKYEKDTCAGYLVRVQGGDLTVNGGNTVIKYRGGDKKNCCGVGIVGGNLYVKGGSIYSESYNSANLTNAAYMIDGNVYVTGGILKAYSAYQSGIRANNFYISGGKVESYSSYGALLVTSETGVLSITGGEVHAEASVTKAYGFAYMYKDKDGKSAQGAKVATIASGLYVSQGKDRWSYVDVDKLAEFKFDSKYIRVATTVAPPTVATEPPPTTAPTKATVATVPLDPNAKDGDAIPKGYTLKIGGTSHKLTKYGEVIYLKNVEKETKDIEGNTFIKTGQTKEGADETNWNLKLVWTAGDPAPKLYLRGFKFDEWNNETSLLEGKWDETNQKYKELLTYSITTDSNHPIDIILTGEDSMIEAHFGITFYHNTTITSEGDTKLTMNNVASCIAPNHTAGSLTINANLDLTLGRYYNSQYAAAVVHTHGGTLTINGGNIKLKCNPKETKTLIALHAKNGADLIINGGNIDAMSIVGKSRQNGCIRAGGKIIINGGTVKVNPKEAVGLHGYKGIEMNGGVVNVTAPWYAISTGDKDHPAEFVFNGGTLTVMGQFAFHYEGTTIKLGEGAMAYAGASKRDCEVYDGTTKKLAQKPWMLFTNDPDKFIEIEEEEEDDAPIFTLPTTPTQDPNAPGAPDATVPDAPDATYAPEEPDSNLKVDLVEGTFGEISQELIDAGFDTDDKILQALIDSLWLMDENLDRATFFDGVLMFRDGDTWIEADEDHFPEDGFLKVVIPYPVGTNINTQFTALHMFSSAAFDKIPGDIELLLPENTENGIEVYVTGLSPIILGWNNAQAMEGGADMEGVPENPETGDTGVAMIVALLVVAMFGMVAVVYAGKKRII